MTRTVVLGFDALDVAYLDRYADSLPNFAALRERGVEAALESTHPPWTGSAWPSMYTGTDPSHHGVYGFFEYETYPDEGSLVSRRDVDRPALWDYLSADGGRSIVMNVPVTHPADPIEGVLIPGYLAPEEEPGHPASIRDDLSAAIGEEYTIYSRGEVSDDPEEKFAGYLDLIDQRRRAARALLDREAWDLAVFQVQKTDAVFHNFDDDDRFRAVYEAADRFLGTVVETIDDETNVVVCSDHGIGPVTGYRIYVNQVLADRGFVEPAAEDDRPTLASRKSSLVGAASSAPGPLARTLLAGGRLADRVGVGPGEVYAAADRVGLGDALLRLVPPGVGQAIGQSVDWRASRAYCPDATRMGVRINLVGREPEGVVPAARYEAVRDGIVEILSNLETPDGNPAFEFVRRREEIYDGPAAVNAPDVCFLPAGMNHVVSTALYGPRFLPIDDHDHKPEGVFVGAGPAFSGEAPDRLSLTDVAPIAMALSGRPVPETMTGAVPPGLLAADPTRADYGDIAYATASAAVDGDDGAVTERLEDLGYL